MIRSNRTRRATLKTRTRTQRAASRINRHGVGTLATHCIAAGLGVKEARTVAGSLRKNADKAGVIGQAGTSYAKNVKARTCTRYTPAEVAAIAVIYRPRKPAYKAAAARLALTGCGLGEETVTTTPKATSKAEEKATEEKTEEETEASAEKTAAVGDTLTLKGLEDGEQLDVTLKQWLPTAKPATEYDIPQDGKRWAAAQFELVNTGSKVYSDSPSNGAKAADSEGQRFDAWFGEISAGPAMSSDVSLPKGEKALGWIVFEVPKDSNVVSVQFGMNSGFSNQTGQWTVK